MTPYATISSLELQTNVNNLNADISMQIEVFGPSSSHDVDEHLAHFLGIQSKLNQMITRLEAEKRKNPPAAPSSLTARVAAEGNKVSPLKSSSSLTPSPCAPKKDPNPVVADKKPVREFTQISNAPQGPNARFSSLYTGPSHVQKPVENVDHNLTGSGINPFAFTAAKMGIPEVSLRNKITALQTTYASSALTTVCGVEIMGKVASLVGFLNNLNAPQEFDKLFQYSEVEGGQWRCTVVFREERLGEATNINKEEARKEAEKAALKTLAQHPLYFDRCLIQVPQGSVAQPTAVLLQFLQIYSSYNHGDELQGIYRTYMKVGQPHFTCQLTFNNTNMVQPGDGETKRRAREAASLAVLNAINHTVQRPKEIYFEDLNSELNALAVIDYFKSINFVNDLVLMIVDYLAEIPFEDQLVIAE